MDVRFFIYRDLIKIFGENFSRTALILAEKELGFPKAEVFPRGKAKWRGWKKEQLPFIGARFGFLKKILPKNHRLDAVVTVFTQKGGVLKTTLAYLIARVAALHNIKTCIIGLDPQQDITTAIGHNNELERVRTVVEANQILRKTKGLYDLFSKEATLDEIVREADLPSLWYIPETDGLQELAEGLKDVFERDYWLEDKVITPLKEMGFELIVFDCSPTSGRIIENAIVSSDLLVSPAQCKINHYNNIKRSLAKIENLAKETGMSRLNLLIVPTCLSRTKVLSNEIFERYKEELPNCSKTPITESTYGDEAMASNITIIEHLPAGELADEARELLKEIFNNIVISTENKDKNYNDMVRLKRSRIKQNEHISSTTLN